MSRCTNIGFSKANWKNKQNCSTRKMNCYLLTNGELNLCVKIRKKYWRDIKELGPFQISVFTEWISRDPLPITAEQISPLWHPRLYSFSLDLAMEETANFWTSFVSMGNLMLMDKSICYLSESICIRLPPIWCNSIHENGSLIHLGFET